LRQWPASQPCQPLAILAGSAGPPSAEFYRAWINASAAIGRGLIILEQDLVYFPPNLHPHVRVLPHLSLNELLPHVAALLPAIAAVKSRSGPTDPASSRQRNNWIRSSVGNPSKLKSLSREVLQNTR